MCVCRGRGGWGGKEYSLSKNTNIILKNDSFTFYEFKCQHKMLIMQRCVCVCVCVCACVCDRSPVFN